jgi:hypothetical protein
MFSGATVLETSMVGSDGGTDSGGAIVSVIGAGTMVRDATACAPVGAVRRSIGFGAGATWKTMNSGFGGVGDAAFPCIVAAVVKPMMAMCAATLSAAPPVRRCR